MKIYMITSAVCILLAWPMKYSLCVHGGASGIRLTGCSLSVVLWPFIIAGLVMLFKRFRRKPVFIKTVFWTALLVFISILYNSLMKLA